MLLRLSALRVSFLLIAGAATVIAADAAWKAKPTPAWTADDARQILTESPWAKTVKALVRGLQTEDERKRSRRHGAGAWRRLRWDSQRQAQSASARKMCSTSSGRRELPPP